MKKFLPVILACIVLFASCKKFLDQDPNSQATDQTTWKSEGDANASVAACYALMRSAFNASLTYYSYGDIASDELTGVSFIYGFDDVYNMRWGISIPPANNWDPRLKLRLYTNFYAAIAQSNRCLHFINDMPVTDFNGNSSDEQQQHKNKYTGEAYFTRAFNYYYISRVWGDVPLQTTYNADVSSDPQLPRSPQADVLAQAISDAKMAVQYLGWKDESSNDRAVRGDKGAAYALLANIYAWQGKYDSCNMMCDAVISSGSYTLTVADNYMDIYKGQSTESIFEIASNTAAESQIVTDPGISIAAATLTPPYINNGRTEPFWQINTGVINSLYNDTNDVRYQKAFLKIPGNGSVVYECLKYANIQNVNNNNIYQVALNNIIVFRLADVELLKAEALAAKSTPDAAGALTLVNDVRMHRGITTPLTGLAGKDLLYEIFNERGRELFLEGFRFFDLIRLERLTGEQQFPNMSQGEFLQGKYYWPVDPTLFLTNSKLTQTPYWVGKIK